MLLNNKFAIGCLVQFYEIDIIEEYINSVKYSLEYIENKENVIVDFCFNINEGLEQLDKDKIEMEDIVSKFNTFLSDFNVEFVEIIFNKDEIFTIADYRREFNDKYCDDVDVLMWGESDSLIP